MDLSFLSGMPAELRETLLYGVPFLMFTLLGASVMLLGRDLFSKPKPRGLGSPGPGRDLDFRGTSQTGGARTGVRSEGGRAKKNNRGIAYYSGGHDLAIPQLNQPNAGQRQGGVSSRMESWFARILYESGAPFARDVAFMVEFACGLLVGGVLFIVYDDLPLAVVGFFLGMFGVVGIYLLARARRCRVMREQLPDVIDHMARAVRAGQTIDQSLHLVGDTAPEPLGIEFRRCAGQLDMGLSVDAAMRALSRRVPIPEMRILASTFIVQRRAGGSLPVTLERMAKVIRDRVSYLRQFRAATAGSRMSMLIVTVTAPAVACYMAYFQPDRFERFFGSQIGMMLGGAAVVFYVLGLLWISFILRNDY